MMLQECIVFLALFVIFCVGFQQPSTKHLHHLSQVRSRAHADSADGSSEDWEKQREEAFLSQLRQLTVASKVNQEGVNVPSIEEQEANRKARLEELLEIAKQASLIDEGFVVTRSNAANSHHILTEKEDSTGSLDGTSPGWIATAEEAEAVSAPVAASAADGGDTDFNTELWDKLNAEQLGSAAAKGLMSSLQSADFYPRDGSEATSIDFGLGSETGLPLRANRASSRDDFSSKTASNGVQDDEADNDVVSAARRRLLEALQQGPPQLDGLLCPLCSMPATEEELKSYNGKCLLCRQGELQRALIESQRENLASNSGPSSYNSNGGPSSRGIGYGRTDQRNQPLMSSSLRAAAPTARPSAATPKAPSSPVPREPHPTSSTVTASMVTKNFAGLKQSTSVSNQQQPLMAEEPQRPAKTGSKGSSAVAASATASAQQPSRPVHTQKPTKSSPRVTHLPEDNLGNGLAPVDEWSPDSTFVAGRLQNVGIAATRRNADPATELDNTEMEEEVELLWGHLEDAEARIDRIMEDLDGHEATIFRLQTQNRELRDVQNAQSEAINRLLETVAALTAQIAATSKPPGASRTKKSS